MFVIVLLFNTYTIIQENHAMIYQIYTFYSSAPKLLSLSQVLGSVDNTFDELCLSVYHALLPMQKSQINHSKCL
jgi:hypothetical protein